MNPERWQQIQDLFHAAAEQPSPAAAEEFLAAACGEDGGLYEDVQRMLKERERTGILDRAAFTPPNGPAESPVFSPGQTVAGRYRVIRYVSRGGMGEVYEAEDRELGERVALKTLLPAIASDTRMIDRFKQEIALSHKVSHSNVCRVFDLVRAKGEGGARDVIFLTMEFLDGQTLSAHLEGGTRMTTADALPLVNQMAAALDAAHRAGIVHRDFKPSNVMLAPGPAGPRAVVTDFGLARSFEGGAATASMSGRVMGTLDYMAPELLTGGSASPVSDVYALGMVVYRMVSGALPFPSDTPLGGVVLRAQEAPPSPRLAVPNLDWRWEHAILKALAREPARRFSRAGDFAAALRGDSGTITVPLPAFSRRRLGAGMAAVALLAAAWLGWHFWERAHGGPAPEAQALYQKGLDDLHAGAYYAAAKALADAVRAAPAFTQARVRLAEAWIDSDMSERASEQILLARRGDVASLPDADRLRMDAVDWTVTREFALAARNYEALAKLAGPGDADAAVELARAYENADMPAKAVASYRQAAEGAAHSPVAWLRLGVLYGRQGDQAQSGQAFDQAESLYQLTSNLEGLAQVAYERGVALDARGNLEAGAASLNKALETAHLADNAPQEVLARLQLSINAGMSGDNAAAERYANQALEAASADQMTSQAVRGILRLGNVYLARRDFAAAERHFDEALALARRDNSDRWAAAARLSLASLYDQLKRPDQQAQDAQEALSYYEPHRFARETAQCLILLERAQVSRGQYTDALASGQRLLAAAAKRGDAPQVVLAHEALGQVYSALELLPKALEEFRASAAAAPSPEAGYYGFENCAAVLAKLGRYGESQSDRDLATPGSARFLTLRLYILQDRAEAALTQNRFAEAAALVKQALALDKEAKPAEQAGLQRVLGLALAGSGDPRGGLRHCQTALDAIEALHDPHQVLLAQLTVLEALLRCGGRAAALSLFRAMEPALNGQPESRWRALALISSVDATYLPAARQALDDLRTAWGAAWFGPYLERPDVQALARSLDRS